VAGRAAVTLAPTTRFGLSLSKPVLSDAADGVEGASLVLKIFKRREGFDKLSPNRSFDRGAQ
jgi:hypothetical protein